MVKITDVITLLFGAKGERPTTLEGLLATIGKAEGEIARADAQAAEHTRRAEFLASELVLGDLDDDFPARLEREEQAATEARDQAAKLRAALTGLRRRRDEMLARQAEAERAAFVESVRARCRTLESLCGRIDQHNEALALAWNEALTAAAQLQGMMPSAVEGRELRIVLPSLTALAPRPDRPSATACARDVVATALRAIGASDDQERAA